jgi:hypothetical protein
MGCRLLHYSVALSVHFALFERSPFCFTSNEVKVNLLADPLQAWPDRASGALRPFPLRPRVGAGRRITPPCHGARQAGAGPPRRGPSHSSIPAT